MENELRKLGNVEQLAYTKNIEYTNGTSKGVKAILCKNEKLSLTLLESLALDIFDLSYAGVNMSFISRNGLKSKGTVNPDDFSKSFGGGFLYTCGLDNIGKEEEGKVLHGSFSSLPANITVNKISTVDDEIVLEIEGIIHDTALFSKDLEVIRNYKIFKNRIILTDTISNKSFVEQEFIMLYHFNIGYPMMDENTKFKANVASSVCRTTNSNIEKYGVMDAPIDKCEEEVFIHTINDKFASVEVENVLLNQKINFSFDTKNLKYLIQWKSLQSRDYVLGIEPSTSHLDEKKFILLLPNQYVQNQIIITF